MAYRALKPDEEIVPFAPGESPVSFGGPMGAPAGAGYRELAPDEEILPLKAPGRTGVGEPAGPSLLSRAASAIKSIKNIIPTSLPPSTPMNIPAGESQVTPTGQVIPRPEIAGTIAPFEPVAPPGVQALAASRTESPFMPTPERSPQAQEAAEVRKSVAQAQATPYDAARQRRLAELAKTGPYLRETLSRALPFPTAMQAAGSALGIAEPVPEAEKNLAALVNPLPRIVTEPFVEAIGGIKSNVSPEAGKLVEDVAMNAPFIRGPGFRLLKDAFSRYLPGRGGTPEPVLPYSILSPEEAAAATRNVQASSTSHIQRGLKAMDPRDPRAAVYQAELLRRQKGGAPIESAPEPQGPTGPPPELPAPAEPAARAQPRPQPKPPAAPPAISPGFKEIAPDEPIRPLRETRPSIPETKPPIVETKPPIRETPVSRETLPEVQKETPQLPKPIAPEPPALTAGEVVSKIEAQQDPQHFDKAKIEKQVDKGGDVYVKTEVDPTTLKVPGEKTVEPGVSAPEKGAIIVDDTGKVIDGRHRVVDAKAAGETAVPAYVPRLAQLEELAKGQKETPTGGRRLTEAAEQAAEQQPARDIEAVSQEFLEAKRARREETTPQDAPGTTIAPPDVSEVQPLAEAQPAATQPIQAPQIEGVQKETPERRHIPIRGDQFQPGDRYFTSDYGYVTVESVRPRDPKYPDAVEVETDRGRRVFMNDQTFTIDRPPKPEIPSVAGGEPSAIQARIAKLEAENARMRGEKPETEEPTPKAEAPKPEAPKPDVSHYRTLAHIDKRLKEIRQGMDVAYDMAMNDKGRSLAKLEAEQSALYEQRQAIVEKEKAKTPAERLEALKKAGEEKPDFQVNQEVEFDAGDPVETIRGKFLGHYKGRARVQTSDGLSQPPLSEVRAVSKETPVDIEATKPQIEPESEKADVSRPRQPIERIPPVDVRQPAGVREGVPGPKPDRGTGPSAPAVSGPGMEVLRPEGGRGKEPRGGAGPSVGGAYPEGRPGVQREPTETPEPGRPRAGAEEAGPAGAGAEEAPGATRKTTPTGKNHVLPQDVDWIPSGNRSKIRANIDAVKLLKTLEEENRNPSPEEKAVLARYTGWGALQAVFDEGKAAYRKYPPTTPEQKREAENWEKNWGVLFDEVKDALNVEERAAAAKSLLNAHYTSRDVINRIWEGVERLGFKGGKALEPAAGVGNFIGLTPTKLIDKTTWDAVELDSISGRITKKLYPESRVIVKGFETGTLPTNSYDLVITNVPFNAKGPNVRDNPKRLSLHNYFISKGLSEQTFEREAEYQKSKTRHDELTAELEGEGAARKRTEEEEIEVKSLVAEAERRPTRQRMAEIKARIEELGGADIDEGTPGWIIDAELEKARSQLEREQRRLQVRIERRPPRQDLIEESGDRINKIAVRIAELEAAPRLDETKATGAPTITAREVQGMSAEDALQALATRKLQGKPLGGGAPPSPFEKTTQDVAQRMRDLAASLDELNDRAKITVTQAEAVAETGTIQPKPLRETFREETGPKPTTYGFKFSEADIVKGQAQIVQTGRRLQELLRQLEMGGDLLSQNVAEVASDRLQQAIHDANQAANLFRKQRFAAGRAVKAYDRPPIPRDVVETLRELGVVIDGLQAARERLPIYTNILESMKNIGDLTPLQRRQLWRDFVDAWRLNLFSVTSWSLDFIGNASEIGAQTASMAGHDLVRVVKGDPTFPSIQGFMRTIKQRRPLPQEIETGLGMSIGGERIRGGFGKGWGTFTKRETPLSASLDYLVGSPLYFKGVVDKWAKRFGASNTLWREAIEEANRRRLRGLDRQDFYNEFWRNPPEDAQAEAIKEGKKAGFDRTLSRFEENVSRSTWARLLLDAFARWPFQFTRWAGEMLGVDPAIYRSWKAGKLTAEQLGGYLAKAAVGWGGLLLLDELLYQRVDFNSMEYVHPNGDRSRLSGRDPIPSGLFLVALLKGDLERATAAMRHASIPGARLLVGEGGLLGNLIGQVRNAIQRADVDPAGLRRNLTDTVNRLIPGQALLSAVKTIFDPKIREGVGANLPGISLLKPAAINPATGEPLEPRQEILGVELPSIGGTPIPGARRILDPTSKILSKYGLMVYRGPRQPIAGYPAGDVPDEIGRDWKVAFGKERERRITNRLPTIQRLERDNPDDLNPGDKTYEAIRKLIQREDSAAAKRATAEINRQQGATRRRLPRQPTVRERRQPLEREPLEINP